MRILGIIAEYNPFHNGHKYHLETAKRELDADYCIAVMSGNFVQRGEPAIIHKWKRAEMCLHGGADLVVELPVHFATASAEFFAEGAVKLLNAMNTDFMSFGAECPSIDSFQKTVEYVVNEPLEYKSLLKSSLSKGISFPKARATALAKLSPVSENNSWLYELPNNILAIEYLKALSKTDSSITPHIVERRGSSHNSDILGEHFSSASAIRKTILSGGFEEIKNSVPTETFRILSESRDVFPIDIDDFSDMLVYKIKTETPSSLREILDVSEGLENRIVSASENDTIRSIISQIKTKRYTFTKIQRILMHILLNITSSDMAMLRIDGPPYIRVLGFKASARHLLGSIIESSPLPVLINLNKDMKKLGDSAYKILEKEITASDIYFSKCRVSAFRRKGVEFTIPVSIL